MGPTCPPGQGGQPAKWTSALQRSSPVPSVPLSKPSAPSAETVKAAAPAKAGGMPQWAQVLEMARNPKSYEDALQATAWTAEVARLAAGRSGRAGKIADSQAWTNIGFAAKSANEIAAANAERLKGVRDQEEAHKVEQAGLAKAIEEFTRAPGGRAPTPEENAAMTALSAIPGFKARSVFDAFVGGTLMPKATTDKPDTPQEAEQAGYLEGRKGLGRRRAYREAGERAPGDSMTPAQTAEWRKATEEHYAKIGGGDAKKGDAERKADEAAMAEFKSLAYEKRGFSAPVPGQEGTYERWTEDAMREAIPWPKMSRTAKVRLLQMIDRDSPVLTPEARQAVQAAGFSEDILNEARGTASEAGDSMSRAKAEYDALPDDQKTPQKAAEIARKYGVKPTK